MVLLRKNNLKRKDKFYLREILYCSFQTPAARFQEARRDIRSTNNNNNNIRSKKSTSNAAENKQKQRDNKRVNNQPNCGVS